MNKLRRWLTFSEDGPDPATMVLRWFAAALVVFAVGASLRYLWWRQYHCTPWDNGLIVKELPTQCVLLPQPGFYGADSTFVQYGKEGNRWIFRFETAPVTVPKLYYVTLRPGARTAELSIQPDDLETAKVLTEVKVSQEPRPDPLLQPGDWPGNPGRSGGFDMGFRPRWDWLYDFGNGQRIHLRGCEPGEPFWIGDLQFVSLRDDKYYALMCIMPPRGKK